MPAGLSDGPNRRFAIGGAFVLLFVLLDWSSSIHELGELGITLWNPSSAISILLLVRLGLGWAPVVGFAALLSQLIVFAAPHGVPAALLTSFSVALGYSALTWTLVRGCGFRCNGTRMRDVACLLVVVPLGVLLTAALYCGGLLLVRAIEPGQFVPALAHFWIGDTVGAVVALPALLVTVDPVLRPRSLRNDGAALADAGVFAIGLVAALWVIFAIPQTDEFHFFYLLFLPVIWSAVRGGFPGATFAILATHLSLVAVTSVAGHKSSDFLIFQALMLALSATGLLLGMAVTSQARAEAEAIARQAELARMARHATAGAMGVALAHQISQPISTVATYVHVAQSQLDAAPSGKPAEASATLDKAAAELQRARDILEGLRDFVSRGRLEIAEVDLVDLAGQVADVARREPIALAVRVIVETSGPVRVCADRLQIEQVLLNLIGNAVDAAAECEDGGGRATVRVERRNAFARIEVTDNGGGIPADVADRLFEPFVSSKPRGMGLGLALSRQIVESHGGRLWWEPALPRGTCFIVELPCDDKRV